MLRIEQTRLPAGWTDECERCGLEQRGGVIVAQITYYDGGFLTASLCPGMCERIAVSLLLHGKTDFEEATAM